MDMAADLKNDGRAQACDILDMGIDIFPNFH